MEPLPGLVGRDWKKRENGKNKFKQSRIKILGLKSSQ
jgi:hypothetical protein